MGMLGGSAFLVCACLMAHVRCGGMVMACLGMLQAACIAAVAVASGGIMLSFLLRHARRCCY